MLTRWNPVTEIERTIDRLFNEALMWPVDRWLRTAGLYQVPMDVYETDDEFVVQALVPGIDPDKLDVTLSDNTLTIRGTYQVEEVEGARYLLRELRSGEFTRSVTLPKPVQEGKIRAEYHNGMLTLHLPKAEEAVAKKIKVQVK